MKSPVSLRTLSGLLTAAVLSSTLLFSACGKSDTSADSSSTGGKTLHLAFIPKGMQNVYWKSVEKGMRDAEADAKKAGVKLDIDWNGPPNEGDRAAEIALMETYVAQKLDGIILCPMEFDALVAPSQKARQAGIPLVIVDSPLNYKDIVAFVGTGNKAAGVMAGAELAKELGDKGNVLMMRFLPGSASTNEREEGFLAEIAKHPNIKVVSSDNYAGDDREKALDKAQNLLNTYKDVDGIFTPNEPSTGGMLLALEKAGLAGKVKFVGFDGGKMNMDGLAAGHIQALVLQDPYQMGYKGVMTMLDYLAGKKVDANVDTGTHLLTKDNQNSPEIQTLLKNTVQ